jgi:hypothetical protein
MATLVRNRPFQKRRTNSIKKQIRKIKLIYPSIKFSVKWLWIFILFVIFSYWTFFIIKNTIFKSENYIEKVSYSKNSADNYDNPYLYKKISELIKGENYFVVSKLKRGKILNTIQDEFPMVKNIKIIQPIKFSASVWISFYEPDIIINLGDRKFGVLWDYDFEIFSWNNIGNWIFSVELPKYISWVDSLHGLFFEISPEKLIYDIDIISQWFQWYKRIVYLPWSSMTVVFLNDDKRVYLNNKNSLTWQINNYNLLMKYYNEANLLKIIDLGSLEWDKIIVRK